MKKLRGLFGMTFAPRRRGKGSKLLLLALGAAMLIAAESAAAVPLRAKGWYRWNALGCYSLGFPRVVGIQGPSYAIGLPPPLGLGIGTAVVDWFIDPTFGSGAYARYMGSFVPLCIYGVHYYGLGTTGYPSPVVYSSLTLGNWLAGRALDVDGYGDSSGFWRLCVGIDWTNRAPPGACWGLAAGFQSWHYQYNWGENPTHESHTSLFFEGRLNFIGLWGAIRPEEIPYPAVELHLSFRDADENGILTKNEDGKLTVMIPNKGAGSALDMALGISIEEIEYRNRLEYTKSLSVGNVEGGGSRKLPVVFKPKEELPKGEFTIDVTCTYKTETGERRIETEKIAVSTAPLSGTVKVSFANLSSQGMPDWIVTTPLEYADYQVEYSGGRASVLNLNTGERKSEAVVSAGQAQSFVRNYFLGWDKDDPTVTLSSSGGTVNAKKLKLPVRLSDDHKLGEMKVFLNGTLFGSESFAEQTETERNLEFPLNMGDNRIRITLSDWVGKQDEKNATFTRIRGDSGTWYAGNLPQGEPPPSLDVTAEPIDGNNTVVGGREEGIRVTVTNSGKGSARLVRVQLSGDSVLIGLWRRERNLEDIKPGQTQVAEFGVLMPSELDRRTATVQVSIKEGRGYSPTEKPSLTFNLVPASVETTTIRMVEDIDSDIPGGTSRNGSHALIVGISNYESGALKYARRDAETFRGYASRTLGIGSVETLFDGQATSSRFRSKLENWLKKKSGFKVVFFSGHGITNPDNLNDDTPYLVPADYDGTASTLLSTKDIPGLCSSPSDTLILVYDACMAGSGNKAGFVPVHVPVTSAVTLAAAGSSQPSREFDKAQHGYFTYYTLLGLRGKADANNDGWVTTTELYRYVKDKVSDATNEVQVPVLRPEREIKLGRYR